MMANKPGRPPLDPYEHSVVVTLRMTVQTFDTMYRRAQVERLSVPEIIRRALHKSANKEIENRDE